jgi:hypothetical protein
MNTFFSEGTVLGESTESTEANLTKKSIFTSFPDKETEISLTKKELKLKTNFEI